MKILIGESVGRSVPITFNFTVNFFLQILYFNVLNAPKNQGGKLNNLIHFYVRYIGKLKKIACCEKKGG